MQGSQVSSGAAFLKSPTSQGGEGEKGALRKGKKMKIQVGESQH